MAGKKGMKHISADIIVEQSFLARVISVQKKPAYSYKREEKDWDCMQKLKKLFTE